MSWIVLCVSDDAASLLLYRSILELDGHNALVAADTDDALKVSEAIEIDCVVVDCEQDGISVTRAISRARPGIPILFVSDQLQLQVYSETGMFASRIRSGSSSPVLMSCAAQDWFEVERKIRNSQASEGV